MTKVVQVCAPNGGSGWAVLQAVRTNQIEFLDSLTKGARQRAARKRTARSSPPMSSSCASSAPARWSATAWLHAAVGGRRISGEGVPAAFLATTHWFAIRSEKGADLLARLVREPQPRWDAERDRRPPPAARPLTLS